MNFDIVGAFVATVVGFGFSYLYYSPFFAGPEWMKSIGMDEPMRKKLQKNKKRITTVFGITFLVNLLSFMGISYILHLTPYLNWEVVVSLSIILWFIISGVGLIQSLFQHRNVHTHILSTVDDAVRIVVGTSILYIMM